MLFLDKFFDNVLLLEARATALAPDRRTPGASLYQNERASSIARPATAY